MEGNFFDGLSLAAGGRGSGSSSSEIRDLCFSPDGLLLAVAEASGTIRLWLFEDLDMFTPGTRAPLAVEGDRTVAGTSIFGSSLMSIQFAPTGDLITASKVQSGDADISSATQKPVVLTLWTKVGQSTFSNEKSQSVQVSFPTSKLLLKNGGAVGGVAKNPHFDCALACVSGGGGDFVLLSSRYSDLVVSLALVGGGRSAAYLAHCAIIDLKAPVYSFDTSVIKTSSHHR